MALFNVKLSGVSIPPIGSPGGNALNVTMPKKPNSPGKIKVYDNRIRIATWNIRSLFMAGKFANVEKERCRLKLDILGFSEVRWLGSGTQNTEEGIMYFSGGTDVNHRYGVAVMVSSMVAKSVLDFIPISDRVMILRLQTSHRAMNIIQVHAPTADKDEEEIESFYNTLEEVMKLTRKGEITLVMGDFNSKVGFGVEGNTVGCHGIGERNERGDRLVQFCVEHECFVSNTFFKLHPRRIYTWTSPADNEEKIVRNQIDFILVKQEHKKCVKAVKTYPGADVNSDHNPVVMDFKMQRLKNTRRYDKISKRIDVRKLASHEMKANVIAALEEKMKVKEIRPIEVEYVWGVIKDSIIQVQKNIIGHVNNNKRKPWMTNEILELMNERRKYKIQDPIRYKILHKEIRRKCREARESWLSDKCKEIEILQKKHDHFNLHKKVKEMSGLQRKRWGQILRNENNESILGAVGKLKRWKEYIEHLFSDDRGEPPPPDARINEISPEITKSEVMYAIKAQKNGKATGPDEVYAEVIKVMADQESSGLSLLTSLFNAIYASGEIPSDWLRSTFIPLPKKSNSSQCDDYRMISLMSHVLKIFLRIIHTRIYKKCESQMGQSQFGFRNGVGTREALFSLNVLVQRCRDMNVDVYACFVDYTKAFDCVRHEKMIEILRATGVDTNDLRIISKLYWNQIADVRTEQGTSETTAIRKGVRQGCVLSPLLFNIYSESIVREVLAEEDSGIMINGTTINIIRYADDTVVIANELSALQRIMNSLVQQSEEFGLSVNASKTKVMVFSKRKIQTSLSINGNNIKQISSFKYLGTILDEQCDNKKEIRSRIEQARRQFISMKQFFVRPELSLELRMRMTRCYVFSVLLYGCESWTLDKNLEKRIESFEMYLYRRLLRLPTLTLGAENLK